MSESQKLEDKASVVVASKVAIAAAQIGMALALPRLMPKEQVGILTFLLLVYETISGILCFGFPQALLYFIPQFNAARRKSLVHLVTIILLLFGVLGGGLLLVFGKHLDVSFNPHPFLPAIALYIAFDLPTLALPQLLIALDRATLAARLNVAYGLITVAGLLVPMASGLRLRNILLVWAGSAAIRLGIFLVVVSRTITGKGARLFDGIGEVFHFSVPLGLSSSAGLLNQQIDKYLIAMSFSATAYADYSFGAREVPIVSILPYTVATVLMPVYVEHWKAGRPMELLRVWHGSMTKIALVMMPLCVILFVAAEAYITLLFTHDYIRAAGPMRIFLLLLPMRVTAYGIILQSLGETRAVLEVSVVSVILNGVMAAGFISWFGFVGPSAATVLVQFIAVGIFLYRINQHLKVGIRGILPWGHLGKVMCVSLLAGPVAWVIVRAFPTDAGLALGLGTLAYLVVYFLLGTFVGVITPSDRSWLLGKFGFKRPRGAE